MSLKSAGDIMTRSRVFLGCEDDALFALAVLVEDDVGDLLVLAVGASVVFGDGLDPDFLAEEDVVLAGEGELGLAGGEFLDDLLGGEAGGWGGIEAAETAAPGSWPSGADAVWRPWLDSLQRRRPEWAVPTVGGRRRALWPESFEAGELRG